MQQRFQVVKRHAQRSLDASARAARIASIGATCDQYEMDLGWQARQRVQQQPMPFRPLDGANRHHDLELRRNAELTAHGRGLVQQVQAEVSQVDGVVDAVDRRGKTRGHRIRDGDDAPRMTPDELRLRVSQPRIGKAE